MGCCGGKVRTQIPRNQQSIVKAVVEQKNSIKSSIFKVSDSVTKSNRVPIGYKSYTCTICSTKTIMNICPVCGNILSS